MENNGTYDAASLAAALRAIGVQKGDMVFSHVGVGFLGLPKEGNDPATVMRVIDQAFSEVLGPEGTWLVPTYTYSFCKGEEYDPATTPSTIGQFTEAFRKLPGVVRSREPIFSVAGRGPKAQELLANLPMDSFGPGSIYDRLVKAGAALCNVGVGFRYATFVHHVEQSVGVPYRYPKVFSGDIVEDGTREHADITYYVRTIATPEEDNDSWPDLSRLEEDARRAGLLHEAPVGHSVATLIRCKDFFDLASQKIKEHPWYLARGYTNH